MIVGIFIGSISFYEYTKTDFEKEREFNEIAKNISITPSGINHHPTIARYIAVTELPDKWPFVFYDETRKIKFISTNNYVNLESFISNSRGDLTHIVVDENSNHSEFLQEVYDDDEKFKYLNKIFDSENSGFKHHVKLFEINYDVFDTTIMQRN